MIRDEHDADYQKGALLNLLSDPSRAQLDDPRNADYLEFLKAKVAQAPTFGFDVADADIHPILMPHQRAAVRWAIKGGRRALFESFGLGKSVQQLEVVRIVRKHDGGRGLIVCPLDPFGGLLTVAEFAVRLGRRGWSSELSHSYFVDGLGYVRAAEEKVLMPSLFDLMTDEDVDVPPTEASEVAGQEPEPAGEAK